MRWLFGFFATLFLMALALGCVPKSGDPVTESRVLKTANAIYLDVRTVVTDPEVKPLFFPRDLEKLADLEQQYLEAAAVLELYPSDAGAIAKVSYLGGELLGLLDEVVVVEKYRSYLAAIRISIKLLRNHI